MLKPWRGKLQYMYRPLGAPRRAPMMCGGIKCKKLNDGEAGVVETVPGTPVHLSTYTGPADVAVARTHVLLMWRYRC